MDPDGHRRSSAASAGSGPVIVGSAQTVADELERWVDEGGIDGFNFAYAITPGTFEDLVELVVPELQRRGRARTEYEGSTLRESLYGPGQVLAEDTHPARRYHGAFTGGASAADGTRDSKISDRLAEGAAGVPEAEPASV